MYFTTHEEPEQIMEQRILLLQYDVYGVTCFHLYYPTTETYSFTLNPYIYLIQMMRLTYMHRTLSTYLTLIWHWIIL